MQFCLCYAWIEQGYDNHPIENRNGINLDELPFDFKSKYILGNNSGYLLNLSISIQYIFLFLNKCDEYQFSMLIPICRLVGSGIFCILFYFKGDPHNIFAPTAYIFAAFVDIIYIWLLKSYQLNRNNVKMD